ncbi:MAG: flagellar basal body L-ring protein FlgH [Leptospirales bacterium]|nr:flagellar basal body L-ring protein FlgH [Leptospirales bacterium]
MKQASNRQLLALSVATLLAATVLGAQSLWRDQNPYNPRQDIRDGVVLRLVVDEPIILDYEYENTSDQNVVIKLNPDQKLFEFLPPADSNQSITNKRTNRVRARSRLSFRIAVQAQGDPSNGVVSFVGRKLLAYENGRSRQELQISGRVHVNDIHNGRMVHSNDVAELQIVMAGAPVPQSQELPLKQAEAANGQPPGPSAQINEQERARLLLDHLNRILGETASDR